LPAITTATDFTVLGAQTTTLPGTIAALDTTNFAVRTDGTSYFIDLPSLPGGLFRQLSESADFWDGGIEGTCCNTTVEIFKPQNSTPVQLTYTTFGEYFDYDFTSAPAGVFAFGTATPSGAVPTTGSATYDAIVAGMTLDQFAVVHGTATLQFDFGAGTLAGSMSPTIYSETYGPYTSLGIYTFTNTVFGIGHTTFSGDLSRPGLSTLGSFNGLFTGPAAQELMARWTAPFESPDNPGFIGEMFGVWVGKKSCC
jgi:hypothetical protein